MTLVQFIVNFLKPYADMPEFTTCVMRAMRELGHGVTEKSMYIEKAGSISEITYDVLSTISCRLADKEDCCLAGKEAHAVIVDELCDE